MVQDLLAKCGGNRGCAETREEGEKGEIDVYAQAKARYGKCAGHCVGVYKEQTGQCWAEESSSAKDEGEEESEELRMYHMCCISGAWERWSAETCTILVTRGYQMQHCSV